MTALTEFAEAFAAQARRAGVQRKDRALLHKELLPALAYAARVGDARAVSYIAGQINAIATVQGAAA
jgi:hypothetical protein